MFILPTGLDEEVISATTERVRTFVTSRGGDIQRFEIWGRRRLAYPIERHLDGVYHIAQFTMDPQQADELDRNLRLNEQVLRHLIVRVGE
jgi:small subunit ribosomal protein S6